MVVQTASREPIKLPYLILAGVLVSITVLGSLVWFFAWYETNDISPLSHDPRLSQDQWFGVIRNAVTAAAALGVGVTLFFSYRRQQTAEKTQLIGAKAQQTAAEALVLSNKQHALDQERRRDAVISELRTRYGKTAEQLGSIELAVRLAGIYSLAALADDWSEAGNKDEQQVCIDLLCAYYRTSAAAASRDSTPSELTRAILQAVSRRLKAGESSRKYWGDSRISLTGEHFPAAVLSGVELQPSGRLSLHGVALTRGGFAFNLTLNGGELHLADFRRLEGKLTFINTRVNSGWLDIAMPPDYEHKHKTPPQVAFMDLVLKAGELHVGIPQCHVVFERCTFDGGRLSLSVFGRVQGNIGKVTFRDCTFNADVFSDETFGVLATLHADSVVVEPSCTFGEGVSVIESHG